MKKVLYFQAVLFAAMLQLFGCSKEETKNVDPKLSDLVGTYSGYFTLWGNWLPEAVYFEEEVDAVVKDNGTYLSINILGDDLICTYDKETRWNLSIPQQQWKEYFFEENTECGRIDADKGELVISIMFRDPETNGQGQFYFCYEK